MIPPHIIYEHYDLLNAEYQPYPLFTAFSFFLSPFEYLEDVLVLVPFDYHDGCIPLVSKE